MPEGQELYEYTCPHCGTVGEVPRSAKWKMVFCRDCRTTILNEDIEGFDT